MENIVLKVNQEKARILQKTVKEQIFKSKKMSAEKKLELFQQCLQDIETSQDICISNKALYTTIKGTDITKFYNLAKCHGLKHSPDGNAFIEMTVEPGGYRAACKNQVIDFPATAVMTLPIWDIYTPSLYETLKKIVPTQPYREILRSETEKVHV